MAKSKGDEYQNMCLTDGITKSSESRRWKVENGIWLIVSQLVLMSCKTICKLSPGSYSSRKVTKL